MKVYYEQQGSEIYAWLGGQIEHFHSLHELLISARFDYGITDPQLIEVTDDNWQELYDSGAFHDCQD